MLTNVLANLLHIMNGGENLLKYGAFRCNVKFNHKGSLFKYVEYIFTFFEGSPETLMVQLVSSFIYMENSRKYILEHFSI